MKCVARPALLIAVAAFALMQAGCGKSRPANVAVNPGECYVDLSDFYVEIIGTEVKFKVHYKFSENMPHPDAWFACSFGVEGGGAGTVTVRKQAHEMGDEGDFEGTMNTAFLRRQGGVFTAKVKQASAKEGPYNDVSDKLGVEL